jgi:hypothetical protein
MGGNSSTNSDPFDVSDNQSTIVSKFEVTKTNNNKTQTTEEWVRWGNGSLSKIVQTPYYIYFPDSREPKYFDNADECNKEFKQLMDESKKQNPNGTYETTKDSSTNFVKECYITTGSGLGICKNKRTLCEVRYDPPYSDYCQSKYFDNLQECDKVYKQLLKKYIGRDDV